MSTSPPKKAAKSAAALPGLKKLPSQLRALADQLERLGPVLNPAAIKTEWSKLTSTVERLSKLEVDDLLTPLDDYLACSQSWLEAWSKAPGAMEAYCTSTLGAKSKSLAAEPGEDSVEHHLRLLGSCLGKAGQDGVKAAMAASQRPVEAKPQTNLIQDTDARDLLHQLGGLPEDEFLALAKKTDLSLLQRAAGLLGFKLTAKLSSVTLKKVHRAAVQFHRNTRV